MKSSRILLFLLISCLLCSCKQPASDLNGTDSIISASDTPLTQEAAESSSEETSTEMQTKETEPSSEPTSEPHYETVMDYVNSLAPDTYGVDAYHFLRTINDSYPYRMNGNGVTSQTKFDLADFIQSNMTQWGYEVQSYTRQGSSPDGNVHTAVSYSYRKPGSSQLPRILIGAHYDGRETNGCEDNGTGVALTLELAKRFSRISTPYPLEFCFWDGEELLGLAGSSSYFDYNDSKDLLLAINLDCIGFGDNMYAYGGYYENGELKQAWGYELAMTIAEELGIPLQSLPAAVGDEYPEMQTPARLLGSDQRSFYLAGVAYVYFEANAWVDASGTPVHPEGGPPYQYNSAHPAFSDTSGKILHTKYDDLDLLESILGTRGFEHISGFSQIVTELLLRIGQ